MNNSTLEVIFAVIDSLIKLALDIRTSAQRTGEWTPEQDAAFDQRTDGIIQTAAHWKK